MRRPAEYAGQRFYFPAKHHQTVLGQNDSGQNGTDKMVWTEWYTDKMVLDKMAWTKWYGQNGTEY